MQRPSLFFERAKTFTPYINNSEAYNKLVRGMNQEDKETIDIILNKIETLLFHNVVDRRIMNNKKDLEEISKYMKYIYSSQATPFFKKHRGLLNEYYIHHDVKKYNIKIPSGDILDCGAYIGDSAVTFSHIYPDTTIHSFEPDPDTFVELNQTIEYFGLQKKIVPVKFGLGEKSEHVKFSQSGPGSKISQDGTVDIEIISIDSYVEKNKLSPKLIKRDIEGFEYSSILGAKETLKKYKPYLFISIYHTGKDFFEIKTLLESWNVGYSFSVTRRNYIAPFADTLLVAIPHHE